MITGPPLCRLCKHYRPTEDWPNKPSTCTAFPNGIPEQILTNQADHRKPFKGDDGVRFEAGADVTPLELKIWIEDYLEVRA